MNFPIVNYPTKAETDPDVLYQSLGSFWTQIFQDKLILKGYTVGLAEELIQRYMDLIEVINSYSTTDIPVFHREKWLPLVMYKSKFGSAPFIFEEGSAVFGSQSDDDKYYRDVTFQFGFPKKPVAQVYLYNVGKTFKNFALIADRIIDPSTLLINGTDATLDDDGILYFNQDIFSIDTIPKIGIISENGEPVTFTDNDGNVVADEMIILWAYQGDADAANLYKSFGHIFSLNYPSTESFKYLLETIFALYVNGPTIKSIKSICSAFLGISSIIELTETVEEIFTDDLNQYVITDKNVYRFELYHELLDTVVPGAQFTSGDILIDAIQYYDNVSVPTSWWLAGSVLRTKLALSQYLFLGNYNSQLIFSNSIELVTIDGDGYLHFPVEGTPADVKTFNDNLNYGGNLAEIKLILGLHNPGDGVPINPVDFIIRNFLKNNLAFLKFKFDTNEIQSKFISLLPILKAQLPPYTYIIFDLELHPPNEEYNQLNAATPITFDSGTQLLNADGSNSIGDIEKLQPYQYKDAPHRLFSISLALLTQPYEVIAANYPNNTVNYETAVADGRLLQVKDGRLLVDVPPGATSLSFPKLSLINFF